MVSWLEEKDNLFDIQEDSNRSPVILQQQVRSLNTLRSTCTMKFQLLILEVQMKAVRIIRKTMLKNLLVHSPLLLKVLKILTYRERIKLQRKSA